MEKPVCAVQQLGLVDYQVAWDLQDRLAGEIGRGERPPTLLLLEHPHTYTFGRRGQAQNLLWDEAERQRRGVSVFWVDRGGDVTYHGPGQLVGYPLLPLAPPRPTLDPSSGPRLPQADYTGYLRKLEETLLRAVTALGVAARRVEGLTGVWVDSQPRPAKLAAIGVKVDARGLSRHGFALNVNPDMEYWQGIVGCGLQDYPITSLAQLLDSPPDMNAVANHIIAAFGEVFHYEMVAAHNTE